jgi:16S rRNA (guanine(966)-N(2))-methyltransferase RsmD
MTTRPTAERVKEAVFSMLQFDIEGREVLDLFSGSGQMALEALSRGAYHAVLIDRTPEAIRVIQENAEKTKLLPQCSIYRSDALDYIRRNQGKQFDIIFLDPPYASDLYQKSFKALYECHMLKPSTLIVCESDSEQIFGNDVDLGDRFQTVKTSRYSKTVISILSLKNSEVE